MKGKEWYQDGETAEEYDEWRLSRGGELVDRDEKRMLFKLIGDVEDISLLESACGTGRFTLEFLERGAEVTGVDISEEMLAEAREKTEGMEARFLRGDGKDLPFPDDSFEKSAAMRFFHLADDPAEYLREMDRVTEEAVVFDTFSKPSARNTYNRFLPMGSNLYSWKDVHRFVEKADLEVVEAETDFLVPFGVYRVTPKKIAKGVRKLDRKIQEKVGETLCSVDYWKVK